MLSSLESLSLAKHYRDDALFSWRIHRTRTRSLMRSRLLPVWDSLFFYPNILLLHVARIVSAILVVPCLHNRLQLAILCVVIALTSILFTLRGPDGKNGADQMVKVIFTSIGLCLLSPRPSVWHACIYFLCGQLLIAYLTSGVVRIRQAGWRDGSFLLLVLRQETYSHRWVWELSSKYPLLVVSASLLTLMFECSFPLSLILPLPAFLIFLSFGVLFHVFNGFILGLNTFFWIFVGLYPAVWRLWLDLHTFHR